MSDSSSTARREEAGPPNGQPASTDADDQRPPQLGEEGGFWAAHRDEVLVGLAFALALGLAVAGVQYMAGLALWQDTYALHTRLEEAGGLTEGKPVTMSGLQVGRVRELRLTGDGRAVAATFQIEGDTPVPEGSTARLTGISALGGVQVAIEPGPPGAPPLEAGARIASAQGGGLSGLAEQAPQMAGRLDSALAGAAGTFEEAETLLAGSQGAVRQSLENVQAASGAVRRLVERERAEVGRSVENIEALTRELREASAEVSRLARTQGDSLAQARRTLSATLRKMEAGAGSARQAGADLAALTQGLRRGGGTLGRLLQDSSLYVHTDTTMARLGRLLKGIEENPERYLGELKLVELF